MSVVASLLFHKKTRGRWSEEVLPLQSNQCNRPPSFQQNNVACNFTSIINFIQGYEGAYIAHSLSLCFVSWVDSLNHAVPSYYWNGFSLIHFPQSIKYTSPPLCMILLSASNCWMAWRTKSRSTSTVVAMSSIATLSSNDLDNSS